MGSMEVRFKASSFFRPPFASPVNICHRDDRCVPEISIGERDCVQIILHRDGILEVPRVAVSRSEGRLWAQVQGQSAKLDITDRESLTIGRESTKYTSDLTVPKVFDMVSCEPDYEIKISQKGLVVQIVQRALGNGGQYYFFSATNYYAAQKFLKIDNQKIIETSGKNHVFLFKSIYEDGEREIPCYVSVDPETGLFSKETEGENVVPFKSQKYSVIEGLCLPRAIRNNLTLVGTIVLSFQIFNRVLMENYGQHVRINGIMEDGSLEYDRLVGEFNIINKDLGLVFE